MGLPVLIIGASGSGKSTSMRNLKDFGLFNVIGKELPFKNDIQYIKTDDYVKIKGVLAKGTFNKYVIDDSGYLMTNQFMKGHASQGQGNAIFTFYNTIGDNFWGLINFIVNELPRETIVYLCMHEEKNDMGESKPKTIGKMLDEKVCIEGMFTIVLKTLKDNGKYVFETQSNGLDVAKSPMGLFNDLYIDNDLAMVDNEIRKYYNFGGKNGEKN